MWEYEAKNLNEILWRYGIWIKSEFRKWYKELPEDCYVKAGYALTQHKRNSFVNDRKYLLEENWQAIKEWAAKGERTEEKVRILCDEVGIKRKVWHSIRDSIDTAAFISGIKSR